MSDIQDAQRKAYIMGIMYGIIRGYELQGGVVIHQQLNYDVCQAAHCTYQELIDTMNELVRYSDIVKHFLVVRKELTVESDAGDTSGSGTPS
jgi:hypothetical protein